MSAVDEEAIQPATTTADEASKPSADSQQFEERDTRPFFFRHITPIVKFFTILLVAGMWVCTVFLIRDREQRENDFSPWYCLGASVVITLLELLWFIDACTCCQDDGGCCCACWRVLMWIDNWKKGILYIIIAIPTFIKLTVLSVVCGVLLVLLALLYVIKSCADCRCVGGKKFVARAKDKKDSEEKIKMTKKTKKAASDEESPALQTPQSAAEAR